MRIACLQHVKRDFIDCGKEDKDALEVVDIINRFYQEDKKHKVGIWMEYNEIELLLGSL